MLSFNWTLSQRNTCPVSLDRLACARVWWIFHSISAATSRKKSVLKGIRQRSERLQNISFISFVYCVFETQYNNYKTLPMNWTLAYSLWEKVEVNFEHYTDNQQNTWWYDHSRSHNIFFLLFHSSPFNSEMDVDCETFVSNAVLYFSRSQAKMRTLKLCLSLKSLLISCIWRLLDTKYTYVSLWEIGCINPIHDEISLLLSILILSDWKN